MYPQVVLKWGVKKIFSLAPLAKLSIPPLKLWRRPWAREGRKRKVKEKKETKGRQKGEKEEEKKEKDRRGKKYVET